MKLLIIGHKRHGKDTLAEMINEEFGLTFKSSSMKAAEIFIYEKLKDKYRYTSFEQCFNDRINHRKEWYDLITEFNSEDPAKLARLIMEDNDMYVGMRNDNEIIKCIEEGMFDWVIGIIDPRKELESPESFNIDLWSRSDIIVPNGGTLDDLRTRVKKMLHF